MAPETDPKIGPNLGPKVGIVAGGGVLPHRLIEACQKSGQAFHVVAFKDQADPDIGDGIEGYVHWVRLGAIGKALSIFRENGCHELVMGGTIKRPTVVALMPDARAMKFIIKTGAYALGDDGLLSAIVRMLETEEGFRIIGVHHVLPELLAPLGTLTRHQPDPVALADLKVAVHAALDLGRKDQGQAAVGEAGRVLALEEKDGTDAMLERICQMADRPAPDQTIGGVLVKVVKPGQERRVDLPTIGVATIEGAAKAGLRGVGVEAGGAIIVDREQVIETAERLNIFIIGIDLEAFGGAQ